MAHRNEVPGNSHVRTSLTRTLREPATRSDRVNVVLSGKFLPYKTY